MKGGFVMTVKELRKLTGMSQSKFAGYFGIPVRTIQEWEQGRCVPADYIVNLMHLVLRLEGVV